MSVEIVQHIPEPEWKHFLEGCSDATIYHTPEWRRFLETTFDYSNKYLFATDENGRLRGLLPLFLVKSKLTGNRLCSAPFSHECGALGSKNIQTALYLEAREISQRTHTKTLEIRNQIGIENFCSVNNFNSYLLDFPTKPTDILENLCKRKTRTKIKKSEVLGVRVTLSSSVEDLLDFYQLNCTTKQNLGVPCHPWKFFSNLFSILDGRVQLYLSRHDDETIAGCILLYFKDLVLAAYAGADPRSLHLYPYYPLFWKSMTDAYDNGYCTYDFGRVSKGDAGLIQFKKNWRVREKALWYSFSPHSNMPLSRRDSSIYQLSNLVIGRMPMPIYTKFSEMVFPHFG